MNQRAPKYGTETTKIVSYDIWDTVLRRRCHPDAVKLFTSRELLRILGSRVSKNMQNPWSVLRARQGVEADLAGQTCAAGGDEEYRLLDVLHRTIEQITETSERCITELVQNIAHAELAQEKRVTYLDSGILSRIDNDRALRRIFISDFYMGRDSIFELLAHLGISEHFSDGYASCDIGLNKRSGRLFRHVLEVEQCEPNALVHIGDHFESDVRTPERLGIRTIRYCPDTAQKQRIMHAKRWSNRSIALRPEPSSLSTASPIEQLALKSAPLFVGLALFLIEQARERALPELYFFTREGSFLLRLYRCLRAAMPYGHSLPAGRLLAVSRISTFGPSLPSLETADLMRLWSLYRSQSPKAFLSSLDLCTAEHLSHFAKRGFAPDLPIDRPWQNDAFMESIRAEPFHRAATEQIAERSRLLLEYLSQEGVGADLKQCGVVDIGWRGTIQDNIAHLLPKVAFSGFYLGLNQLLNTQPANVQKNAFALRDGSKSSAMERRLMSYVSPIEMLCASAEGSVTAYRHTSNSIEAIRLNDDGEKRAYDEFCGPYQDAVIRIAEHWAPQLVSDAVGSDELRSSAYWAWRELIEQPDPCMLRAYFSLAHNELFGLGEFVSKQDHIGWAWPIRLMLSKPYRNQFNGKLSRLGWPEGYAKKYKRPLLLWVSRRFFRR